MVVANSNNCSNCSMHECVNRQRIFFHPGHIYAQVSLPTPVYKGINFSQKAFCSCMSLVNLLRF